MAINQKLKEKVELPIKIQKINPNPISDENRGITKE